MTLSGNVNALAGRVATEINAVRAEKVARGALVVNVDDTTVGDGVADDTAAFSAALAAGAGNVVQARRSYRLTGSLTVPADTVLDLRTATLTQATANTPLLLLSSGSRVLGGRLVGPQFATYTGHGSERAIQAIGTAGTLITDVRVEDVQASSWGGEAVWLQFVDRFAIVGGDFHDVGYAGVLILSGSNGVIDGVSVRNVTQATGAVESYGIAVTRGTGADLAVNPRSSNVVVTNCTIDGVASWEGIDTHAGDYVSIIGNHVRNCLVGIAVVPSHVGGVDDYAPRNFLVRGNRIDSTVTNGSRGAGINISGAHGVVGAATEYGTGIVDGNIIVGHGDEDNSLSAAIIILCTRGVEITGNVIYQPSPYGIMLYHTCYGFIVAGNTVIDPWSNGFTSAGGVSFRSTNLTGTLGVNTILRPGVKSATYLCNRGYYVSSTDPSIVIQKSANSFNEATPTTGETNVRFVYGAQGSAPVARLALAGNRYIGPIGGTRTTFQMLASVEYATPVYIGDPGSLVTLGMEVTTAGTAGTVIRLGVRSDGGGPLPGTLLLDAGTVAADTVVSGVEVTISLAVTPGLYWFTATAQNTGATLPTVRAQQGDLAPVSASTLASALSSVASTGYTTAATTTGVLPSTYTSNGRSGTPPRVVAKIG